VLWQRPRVPRSYCIVFRMVNSARTGSFSDQRSEARKIIRSCVDWIDAEPVPKRPRPPVATAASESGDRVIERDFDRGFPVCIQRYPALPQEERIEELTGDLPAPPPPDGNAFNHSVFYL